MGALSPATGRPARSTTTASIRMISVADGRRDGSWARVVAATTRRTREGPNGASASGARLDLGCLAASSLRMAAVYSCPRRSLDPTLATPYLTNYTFSAEYTERCGVALNIKNAEVERLAEETSRLAGETKTESIRRALEERLARLRLRIVKRDREAEMLRYLEREVWSSVPRDLLGKRLTRREEDRILGYGPEGA